MSNPTALEIVNREDIEHMENSPVSMMPTGLLNTLNEGEVLDFARFPALGSRHGLASHAPTGFSPQALLRIVGRRDRDRHRERDPARRGRHCIQVFIGGEHETRSVHNMTKLVDKGMRYAVRAMAMTAIGKEMVRNSQYFRLA